MTVQRQEDVIPGGQVTGFQLGSGAPAPGGAEAAASGVSDMQAVAALHLLGDMAKAPAKPKKREAPVPLEAPETRLKLTLHGVFAAEDAQEAWAIVGDARGQERHYGIGDQLPGGAELREVYIDRILLQHDGRYETLRLPEDQERGGDGPARSSSGRRRAPTRSSAPASGSMRARPTRSSSRP